jgi:flagellar biogenesis protein FliO
MGRAHPHNRFRRLLPAGVLGLLFFVSSCGAAFAQRLGQGTDDGVSAWRVVAALLLCMALAVAGAFVLKSGAGRGLLSWPSVKRGRRLHLVETLRVGQQVDLCIVTCDGRELLVASSAHGADLLAHLPMSEAASAPPAEGRI